VRVPALAPPDGTYVYELSRNGTVEGNTTVVVLRRGERHAIDIDEAGAAASARAHVVASLRDDDLGTIAYDATYQAPFLRDAPIGGTGTLRQQTVRYRSDGRVTSVSVDGVRGERRLAGTSPAILDAPFMAAALFIPALARARHDAQLALVSLAFAPNLPAVIPRRVTGTPKFGKTPKNDEVVQLPGIADMWFDRGNAIVHEAHFLSLNFDARLVSYARATDVAPFESAPAPTPPSPKLDSTEVTFASEDGTQLSGVLSRAPGATKKPQAAVVFVAPGAGASRNFGGEGPGPMYPDLARSFAARGYAVLRYDARGVGKSGGSRDGLTWEQSLADAEAAERFAQGDDGLDSKRTFALGYGAGADLALASASSGNASETIAGVVALAPTAVAYRTCARRVAADKRRDAAGDAWAKSSLAHDPLALAVRGTEPLLVFHPGIARCAETQAEVASFDVALRAANARATVIVASDLTERFAGRFDADAPIDTEAFFPYRFDVSTATAIADWLDSPKGAAGVAPRVSGAKPPSAPRGAPPPPPGVGTGPARPHSARPTPKRSFEPGQVQTPSTFGATAAPPTQAPTPAAAPPAPAPKAT